jgi:multimeric flavodoxin WrbA
MGKGRSFLPEQFRSIIMARKVLGIVGSYHKGGTIDAVVSEVLQGAAEAGAEVEKIYLLDQQVGFCRNCRRCTQVGGPEPGPCVHQDDMRQIIAAIEAADALVLGAPVNFGAVNALTQRFLERLVCFSYWPWGQPAPKLRKQGRGDKRAVLITASAMPAIFGRLATTALKSLKKGAQVVGARPTDTNYVGLAAMQELQPLHTRKDRRARRVGARQSR